MASGIGPLGKVLVNALALNDKRGKKSYGLFFIVLQNARHDRVGRLRRNGNVAVGAVLMAKLDKEQTQEMMNLCQRSNRALATASAGALFNGHSGWNTKDSIHLGP